MSHTVEISSSLGTLPSYRKPPVNEVVFGLRFNTPNNLYIPHIGLLWDKFRTDYPLISHASPVTSAKGEIKVDSVTGLPIPRVWFINESDDQLVQFQVDRFYFNWRHRHKDYPRYDYIKNKFIIALNNIITFFKEFNFGDLEPTEFELTYINHIPKGAGWYSIDDLPKIFPDFAWNDMKERFLPKPQKTSWHVDFLLPDDQGHLLISLKHAIRTEDKAPLLVLELKALGFVESPDKEAIFKWFDLAREWIVRGFTDITTPEMHKIWELI